MVTKLVRFINIPIVGNFIRFFIKFLGVEIPKGVQIGNNVQFAHNAFATVIHPSTIIKDNVRIFQNVTIGRADPYIPAEKATMEGIVIENGALICAGAKVLCKSGVLTVGNNTIVAANAVLLESTGENEIWGGIPAKKIGVRKDLL